MKNKDKKKDDKKGQDDKSSDGDSARPKKGKKRGNSDAADKRR